MMTSTQSDKEVVSPLVAVLQRERALPFTPQLPTELLIYSLHLALPEVDFMSERAAITSRSYMSMLYTIRRVAKRWQEVIDGTPSFWTVILSTLPPHVNNATILHSGNLLLAVVYKVISENDWQSYEAFLHAIAHGRSRCSAINLELDDRVSIREFLTTPAPLLQTVVVRSSWADSQDSEPLELLGDQTRNLRYVNISEANIRWRMGLFTQLKALILYNVGPNEPTTSQIFDFLRASPRLEHLDLDGVGITPDSPPSSPIITLPYLKSLSLQCDSSLITNLILRQIQAPSCSKFVVGVINGDGFDPIGFINETLKPFERILREFHIRNGDSELSINSLGFKWQSLSIPDREYGFWLFIGGFLDPLAIRWVGQIPQQEPGLQIGFGHKDTLSQAVFGALAPLQCVTRALITGQGGEANRQIFQFLSTPLSPGSSLPSLPYLRELQISSISWSAQDLLDMVQVRSSAFPWIAMDRPNLAINIRRGAPTLDRSPTPILDLAALSKLKGAEAVESLRFVWAESADGMLAMTWNDDASEPTWG